ncbi:DUF4974 domain-containing protein [Pseudoflavitalea sp. G-6-1-2]|uniref:FecR family protein n=1 Tax=Pseudoflavitalea sp. G-6-1-2 TaxID=2728841 RepID=UPI00146F189F|nr:FecR family protein [Pseudoflavitalea sp. G-6-1-2]NML23279.1 DUF4974 domain-containing protein [Pseudoflavitalea sp. G-6-1-2]
MNYDPRNIDIGQLARKYFDGTATEEEIAILHRWYQDADETDAAIVDITPDEFETFGASMLEDLHSKLHADKAVAPVKRFHFNSKYAAAAAVLIVLCSTGYFWYSNSNVHPKKDIAAVVQADPLPGKDGAILKLANNQQFNLDELQDGVVLKEKGVQIVKNGNEVSYTISAEHTTETGFNTISTSRGQKFNITLPDGTFASLDAASSLKFPSRFDGNMRKVFVSGQVYFDVKADQQKPFTVSANGFQVNVLGTRFNVNAYEGDPYSHVTLLQGSVRLMEEKGGTARTLVPGNQAQLDAQGNLSVVPQGDLEMIMAWREGAFQFRNTEISQVLMQLSRWYQIDIDLQLKDNEPRYFSGRLPRSSSLSDILKILRLSDVNFKLEGNKLIVLP